MSFSTQKETVGAFGFPIELRKALPGLDFFATPGGWMYVYLHLCMCCFPPASPSCDATTVLLRQPRVCLPIRLEVNTVLSFGQMKLQD